MSIPDTIAAIDLGSNSFHMVVAEVSDGEVRIVDRLKEMVRLAAGLNDDSSIDVDAQQRAFEALERFQQRLGGIPPHFVRAVGTNTMRKSKDTGFLKSAEKALGHRIEVVAGIEEARLIYLGVAHSLETDANRRFVVDIGGGSTEMIIGDGFNPVIRESKYMGCVSFSKRYFGDGVIDAGRFARAIRAAKQELQTNISNFKAAGWQTTIGASGTIRSAQEVLTANGLSVDHISRDGLNAVRERLIAIGSVDAIDLAGLSVDRRPVFCGGLAILIAVLDSLSIDRLVVSDGAMREGILYDLLGRLEKNDIRETTVQQMSDRYQVDAEQAALVEASALAMFDHVADVWNLDAESRSVLQWSARIHEMGRTISYSNYHKHGSYLLENSDMPGFSRQDQHLLWSIVRSHRRRLKVHRFAAIDEPLRTRTLRITVLLRIATLLHRARLGAETPTCNVSDDAVELRFSDNYLDSHPLTAADLEAEIDYWNELDMSLSFGPLETVRT